MQGKFDFETAQGRLFEKVSDYESAYKMIFMWVKQGKLSPEHMAKLVVSAYKKFIY